MCRVLFLDVKIWWGAANESRVEKKGWEVGEGFSRVRIARIPTAISFFCCHKCHTRGRNRVKKEGRNSKMKRRITCFSWGRTCILRGKTGGLLKNVRRLVVKSCCLGGYKYICDTCDSKNAKTPVVRICAHVWEWVIIDFFTFRDVWMMCAQFLLLSWVGFCSSVCVKKNNPSFCVKWTVVFQKQPVVLCKVSRRFPKNNPSFYAKCLIVL